MLFLLGLRRHLDNHHMKTSALRFSHGGLAFCLCLVFFSFAARCQPTYGGITANSYVDLNTANGPLDSFNSADPDHSIWQTGMTYRGMPYGVYSDSLSYSSNNLPSRTSDFTVATDGSIIGVNNAEIYGYVNTAPGGSASINRNGSVGDLNWVYDGNTGIEPGHAETNMNVAFDSDSLPNPAANGWQTTWRPVPASLPVGAFIEIGGTWTNIEGAWSNVGGTRYEADNSGTVSLPTPGATNVFVTYSMVITNMVQNTNSVYCSIGQLSRNIFVDAPNVVLYCTNGISLSGTNCFTLNTNADVTVYTSGNISESGNATINNGSDYAKAFSIYDVAGYTNLSFSFTGNGLRSALIYAPSSVVSFGGGGSASYSFIGAIFCNAFSVYGHYSFHYDESLSGGSFPIPPWIIEQPTNQTVLAHTSANFNVVAGGGPTAYQWYFSQGAVSNAIAGATNASLTITNVPLTDAGSYSVVVGNAFGARVSSQASLTVNPNPAAILSVALNPTNQQVYVEVNGFTGAIYALQFSTNLTDWVTVWYGEGSFTNVDLNDSPQRYYRAVFDP